MIISQEWWIQNQPEQCLEILWQFRSACVSRVHGDEESDSRHQDDVISHEVEDVLLVLDGILNSLHLHGNHRQHLDRDAVELIEATPCTRLSQTFVDVADRL